MGDPTGPPARVHQKARTAEYEAFADWVQRAPADPRLRAPPNSTQTTAKPAVPDEVIRHARKDRLLESFENTVWALASGA
jgi:hypothetical protein